MNSTGNTASGPAVAAAADSLNGRIGVDSVAANDSSVAALVDMPSADNELPADGLDAVDSADDHDSQELFMLQ